MKKKIGPSLDEMLEQQWCYYCEREFAHYAALVTHMRDMHFKCQRPGCHKRMSSAQGLEVHVTQVHKEKVTAIENALPGRSGLKPEIYGMLGIPEELLQQRKERITQQYFQAQAERQAATGNPPRGASSGEPVRKKAKKEDKSSVLERFAAYKATKATAATNSGDNTPTSNAPANQSPATPQEPEQSVSIYSAPVHYNYTYSQYGGAMQPGWPPVHPPQASASPQGYAHPQSFAAVPPAGYGTHPLPAYGQQYPSHVPPFSGQMPPPYPLHAGYNPTGFAQYHPPAAPNSVTSPAATFYQSHQASPVQAGMYAPPSALPQPPPGLPQKPAFAAPPVTPYSMQQMHQGVHSGQAQHQTSQEYKQVDQNEQATGSIHVNSITATNAQVDEIVADAGKHSENNSEATNPISDTAATASASQRSEKKPTKKDDKKKIHLVYSDNEVSPEEKLAKLPRFVKFYGLAKQADNFTLSSSVEQTAGVAGVAAGQDDVPNAG